MKLENFKNGYDVTVGSSLALNEKNDCAVRAFANAFNISYDVAHKFAEDKFARKAKKGVKGMFITLSKLGFASFDLFSNTFKIPGSDHKLLIALPISVAICGTIAFPRALILLVLSLSNPYCSPSGIL